MNDNRLPLVDVESLTKRIINRIQVENSQSQSKSRSQILKPTDMSTHPDNIIFIEELQKLCIRMEGNPAQKHYDKFLGYSSRDICDRGAIFNEETYEDNCGPRIGIPQYGRCNNRVWTEVLRGTDIQWVELQKKWKTPVQYIQVMEKSIEETQTLSQWWEFYPKIYGNKYNKNKQSNNNDKQTNNNDTLSSTNNNNKPKPSRKRKHSAINVNTPYQVAPPPPRKKLKQGRQIVVNVHKPPITRFETNNYYNKQHMHNNQEYMYYNNQENMNYNQEYMHYNQQNMNNNSAYMNYNQQNMKHKSQYGNEFDQYDKYNYYESNDTNNKVVCNKFTDNDNDNDKPGTKLTAVSLNSINDALQIKSSKKIRRKKRKKRKKRVKKEKKCKNKWKKVESNPDGMDTFRVNCEKLNREEIKLKEMGARVGRCFSLVMLHDVDGNMKLKRTPKYMKQLISKALRLKKGAQILLGPKQNYNQINKSYKPSKDLIQIVQNKLNQDKIKKTNCTMYDKIKKKYTKWINNLIEDQSDDDGEGSDDIDSSSCSDSNSSDINDNNEPIKSSQFIEKDVENDIINNEKNVKDKKNDNKHDEMNDIENKQPEKEDEICTDIQNMQIRLKNFNQLELEQINHFMNNMNC